MNCQSNLEGDSTIKFIVLIYHSVFGLDQDAPMQRCCVGPSLIRETTDEGASPKALISSIERSELLTKILIN